MAKNNTNSLVPNATILKVDGMEIVIPSNKEENAILAIMLTSQGRAFIRNALKKYQEGDQVPTPKELRDIAGAIRDINESCTAIFDKIELAPPKPQEKTAEKIGGEALDFTVLETKEENEQKT